MCVRGNQLYSDPSQMCVGGWVCVRGNQLYSDPSQMCVWSDDINRFVEDDENEFSYSGKYIIIPLVFP